MSGTEGQKVTSSHSVSVDVLGEVPCRQRRMAMPVLDHFHPPLSEERHWEGFHSKWANVLVDELNQTLLPKGYFAEPHIHRGPRVEIDAATFSSQRPGPAPTDDGVPGTTPVHDWSS